MTTEEIIADLRQNGLTSASIYTRMERAANRLEELERELKQAIIERTPHDYGLLKEEAFEMRQQREAALKQTTFWANLAAQSQLELTAIKEKQARPEPSRLEIAAMAMQGMLAASNYDTLRLSKSAFECADALIAAAKEAL